MWSRNVPPTNRLLNALTVRRGVIIDALDKRRSSSFRRAFINMIITQALTCARQCSSCTEIEVSVTSTDLLLSLVWKPQITAGNNFLKRDNCFLLSSHGEQKGSRWTFAFLVLNDEGISFHPTLLLLRAVCRVCFKCKTSLGSTI